MVRELIANQCYVGSNPIRASISLYHIACQSPNTIYSDFITTRGDESELLPSSEGAIIKGLLRKL